MLRENEQGLEDSDLDDDETEVLQLQHERLLEKLKNLEEFLDSDDSNTEEVAGLMYHIPDPNS